MYRTPLSIARQVGRAACLATALSLLFVGLTFGANGNNGTVKIHDGASDEAPVINNEPHVCTFHLHFFFADAAQAGDWWIDEHPPTGGAQVLDGAYLTDANGEDQTVEMGLPAGHYKLYWEGSNDHNIKHKTFWVTCDNPPGPIGGGGVGGGGEEQTG